MTASLDTQEREAMRAAFERNEVLNGTALEFLVVDSSGKHYLHSGIQISWLKWQSAHQSGREEEREACIAELRALHAQYVERNRSTAGEANGILNGIVRIQGMK